MSIIKKTVLKDRHGATYTFREDKPHIVASNSIYVAEENPEIYIKLLKHPSLLEHPEEHAFIRDKIEHELKTAKTLSDNFFPVPHVYYTKIDTDPEYITGYIVMDRIRGRIISSQRTFDRYFEKILVVLNDLLKFGIVYEDMNINNFIVGEDDEIYVIDFEETVDSKSDSRVVKRDTDGKVSLNEKYIESSLKKSIEVRKKHRMEESPKSSPRNTRKRSNSRSPSSDKTTAKTSKRSPSKSPKKSPPK
jgi:RIO-like serine/threonine protein kinase